jgi:hypothetical protein
LSSTLRGKLDAIRISSTSDDSEARVKTALPHVFVFDINKFVPHDQTDPAGPFHACSFLLNSRRVPENGPRRSHAFIYHGVHHQRHS